MNMGSLMSTSLLQSVSVELVELSEDFPLIFRSDSSPGIGHF